MATPAEFRIYYADGSRYDDRAGPWELAPQEGVLVVAVVERELVPLRGRWLLAGTDYFLRMPGSQYPWSSNELIPALTRALGPTWVQPDPWPSMDQVRGVLRRIVHPTTGLPVSQYVKHGTTVDYGTWNRAINDAWNDPELPAPLSLSRRIDDVPDVSERLERGKPQGPSSTRVTGGP